MLQNGCACIYIVIWLGHFSMLYQWFSAVRQIWSILAVSWHRVLQTVDHQRLQQRPEDKTWQMFNKFTITSEFSLHLCNCPQSHYWSQHCSTKNYIHCVPKPPKGWLKNIVSKIVTISCDNSATVQDRLSVTINH